MTVEALPKFDWAQEIVPSVCEGYVVQVALADPKIFKNKDEKLAVIVPFPSMLLDDSAPIPECTEDWKEVFPHPFDYWLLTVENLREMGQFTIEDNTGEIVFDLEAQGMEAIRFTFRTPRGVFEALEMNDG